MDHWRFFSKQNVLANLKSNEVQGALDESLEVLAKAGNLKKEVLEAIRAKIKEKVEVGATGAIGHGVSVPHVKVPGIETSHVVFALSREGIEFGAGDGEPVHMIFLVTGPVDAPEEHLALMRWIASISRNPDFRNFAKVCKSQKEILELFKEMSGI
jgi:mannitol/fructose-specific phosphotransferase system IIA component (Ntr-type)